MPERVPRVHHPAGAGAEGPGEDRAGAVHVPGHCQAEKKGQQGCGAGEEEAPGEDAAARGSVH